MRAGRPRKVGERYPSGGLKPKSHLERMAENELARLNRERLVVLSQPHRRGETSQMAESPLGRFILRHKLRDELFDAANQWASSKRKWLSALGAPLPDRPGGTGRDVDMSVVHSWRDEAIDGEGVMRRAGGSVGFVGVERLAFDRLDIQPHLETRPVIDALLSLAVFLRRLRSQDTERC